LSYAPTAGSPTGGTICDCSISRAHVHRRQRGCDWKCASWAEWIAQPARFQSRL